MAITFPRAFPLCAFTEQSSFELVFQQSRSLTGGGSPDVADVGPPMWEGKWSTRTLSRSEFAEWDAWLESLRGGLRLFKGRPNRHRWPLAYPKGFSGLEFEGKPFSGSANLGLIGATRDTVTFDELPVGFVLSVGDWFSIPCGSRQCLHRILEGGTADTTGVADVTCEPVIRPGIVTDIPVLFDAPYCDMNLSEKPSTTRNPVRGGDISFRGRQVLI